MEKTLLSFSFVNLITVWLMLFLGLVVLALGTQLIVSGPAGWSFLGNKQEANNSGGY